MTKRFKQNSDPFNQRKERLTFFPNHVHGTSVYSLKTPDYETYNDTSMQEQTR
jgi:hypothetical protein